MVFLAPEPSGHRRVLQLIQGWERAASWFSLPGLFTWHRPCRRGVCE